MLALTADDPGVLLFVLCPLAAFVLLCVAGWYYRRKP